MKENKFQKKVVEQLNRRNFLKFLGIIFGIAITNPTKLLKNKIKNKMIILSDVKYIAPIDGYYYIEIMNSFLTGNQEKISWTKFYKKGESIFIRGKMKHNKFQKNVVKQLESRAAIKEMK